MQSQSEINDTSRDRTWDRDEIAQLIEYANYLKNENEELQAKMIAMNAYVKNSDAKVKYLNNILNTIVYGNQRD
jgi:septal ring factor EnvC (AmiA/AmiB activator)